MLEHYQTLERSSLTGPAPRAAAGSPVCATPGLSSAVGLTACAGGSSCEGVEHPATHRVVFRDLEGERRVVLLCPDAARLLLAAVRESYSTVLPTGRGL